MSDAEEDEPTRNTVEKDNRTVSFTEPKPYPAKMQMKADVAGCRVVLSEAGGAMLEITLNPANMCVLRDWLNDQLVTQILRPPLL